jgi:hypothetical protein
MFPFPATATQPGPIWDGTFTYNTNFWYGSGSASAQYVQIGGASVIPILRISSESDDIVCFSNSCVRLHSGLSSPIEGGTNHWHIQFHSFDGKFVSYKKGGFNNSDPDPTVVPYCICFNVNSTCTGAVDLIPQFRIA